MRVSIEFDALVTFECTYGGWTVKADSLRIFVEKGLIFPYCRFVDKSDGAVLVKCEKDESDRVEEMFPVRYIYDAARQVEYSEWELVDGLLKARNKGGEWVQYKSKSESLYAMNEFVGGCWFVFEGVSFSKSMISEYSEDRRGSTGLEVVQELFRHISQMYLLKIFVRRRSRLSSGTRLGVLGDSC
ncbi:hypothetical protein QZH46_14935 [Pseudomonas corrugata]